MKYCVVYSHPNPQSFNHAILETFVEELKASGQEVRIRDLYALNFDPILKGSELENFPKNIFPDDIKTEQDHIQWADILVFICPIWWGGLTANLRGYFDRVFSLNFAYAEGESGITGLLAEKKALFISTIGAPENVYRDMGMFKSMNQTIDEVIAGFCGMQLFEHKYFSSIGTSTLEERTKMLDEVKELAKRLS